MSTAGDLPWDAEGSEHVTFRSARGQTTYWREEAARLDDVPPPKKKAKKRHRKFTSPVTAEVEAGLERYVDALKREGKDLEDTGARSSEKLEFTRATRTNNCYHSWA